MRFYRLFSLVLLAALLAIPFPAGAGELVSGRYLQGTGKEIEIELEINSPPPLLIVIQNLPRGAVVLGSDPELKTYDPAEGVAKWLLGKVKAGKMRIAFQLDRPVAKGALRGELRFRDEAGRMISIALEN
ncbi:MAG: hypothetical protein RQ753_08730 [Desulfurivibrionaceae bacterium]|nr:hypothetical protein [Desulfobulbales bacterium]MDT8335771.1 hypothetical protein [Desulfurivibrionaceae bacterium]